MKGACLRARVSLLRPVQAVESMRQGMRPREAAEAALRRIVAHYPAYIGALVTVNARGEHAGAAHGWRFEYAVRDARMQKVTVFKVDPIAGTWHGAAHWLQVLRHIWRLPW